MDRFEFFSVYSGVMTLLVIGVVIMIFTMWQFRKKRKRPKNN